MRLCVAALLATCLLPRAATARSLASCLPQDTALYVAADDPGRTLRRLTASDLRFLLYDPRLRALWSDETARRHGGIASVGKILAVAKGPACFALVPGARTEAPFEPVVGFDAAGAETSFEALAAEWGIGRKREEQGRGEDRMVVYRSLRTGAVDGAWIRMGSLVFVAGRPGVLRRLRAPGDEGLAGRASYRKVARRLGGGADLFCWVDPNAILRGAGTDGLSPEAVALLGSGGSEGCGAAVTLGAHSVTTRAYLLCPPDAPLLGAMGSADRGVEPPPFLPLGFRRAWCVRLEWTAIPRALERMGELVPGSRAARLARALQEGPASGLVGGFLDALEGRLTVVTLADGSTVALADVDSRRGVERVLDRLSREGAFGADFERSGVRWVLGARGGAAALLPKMLVMSESAPATAAVVRRWREGGALSAGVASAGRELPDARFFFWFAADDAQPAGRARDPILARSLWRAISLGRDAEGLFFVHREELKGSSAGETASKGGLIG